MVKCTSIYRHFCIGNDYYFLKQITVIPLNMPIKVMNIQLYKAFHLKPSLWLVRHVFAFKEMTWIFPSRTSRKEPFQGWCDHPCSCVVGTSSLHFLHALGLRVSGSNSQVHRAMRSTCFVRYCIALLVLSFLSFSLKLELHKN